MYHSCDVVYLDIRTLVTCVYIFTNISIHTHMEARACAYTAQVQTRDLRYISIWQSINTVIEYRIMMWCFMSIKWLYPGKTILHLLARYMQDKQQTCKIHGVILQEYSFARFGNKILATKYNVSCKIKCFLQNNNTPQFFLQVIKCSCLK